MITTSKNVSRQQFISLESQNNGYHMNKIRKWCIKKLNRYFGFKIQFQLTFGKWYCKELIWSNFHASYYFLLFFHLVIVFSYLSAVVWISYRGVVTFWGNLLIEPIHKKKMLSVEQPGRVPSIETSDIQSNIWRTTFPGMSWSRSQYRVKHCLVAKLLYSVFIRIAAICYYLLNWNAWNALAIITAENKRRMSDSVLIAQQS